MYRKININTIWVNKFFQWLKQTEVEHVCVSPGSRSTPLTLAVAEIEQLKKHIIVDERSSAFFALGIGKATNKPAAVITSSGTALSELMPAVTEAFLTKTPMLLLTADRPPELHDAGANQTIDQNNIYGSHTIKYFEAGIPEANLAAFKRLRKIVVELKLLFKNNPGPVHINFKFRPPFESENETIAIEESLLNEINNLKIDAPLFSATKNDDVCITLSKDELRNKTAIFYCGPEIKSKQIFEVAEKNNIPLFFDVTSNLYYNSNSPCVVNNPLQLFNMLGKKGIFPNYIFQFGSAPTSTTSLKYFEAANSKIIQIDEYGRWRDPSLNSTELLPVSSENFLNHFATEQISFSEKWLNFISGLDNKIDTLKDEYLNSTPSLFEGTVPAKVLKSIYGDSNIFIANSLTVRDLDAFRYKNNDFSSQLFFNRGASGIDGLIATNAGIFTGTVKPTYLIIGDLSFLYDIGSLHILKNLNIPLKIIVINNNGGNIFKLLPVNGNAHFEKYFLTPQNLNVKSLVSGFGGNYSKVNNEAELNKFISESTDVFSVAEIDTTSIDSAAIRRDFVNELGKLEFDY